MIAPTHGLPPCAQPLSLPEKLCCVAVTIIVVIVLTGINLWNPLSPPPPICCGEKIY